jgi:hypothetical protein
MAMTLKTGDNKMFIINTHLTQLDQELKIRIKIKYKKKEKPEYSNSLGYKWETAGMILLNEKNSKQLANYLLDIVYQLGMLDEMDIIKKKEKYVIHNKYWNKNYLAEKSKKEYKNPFKKE